MVHVVNVVFVVGIVVVVVRNVVVDSNALKRVLRFLSGRG